MPEYTVRQVRELRIVAENHELAGYAGSAIFNGDPEERIGGSDSWSLVEEPKVVVFVVELEEAN